MVYLFTQISTDIDNYRVFDMMLSFSTQSSSFFQQWKKSFGKH